jgi:predicted GIY-YIG superfamily endonuclease
MQKPIFIVGCPSSGTTLVYSLLTAHSNISCGNETDFLVNLREIVEGKYWKKLEQYDLEKNYWYGQLANFFDSFKAEYAVKQGKKRWADKTPCYTAHLDFIYTLFPDCQIIHIIRDGRDVVRSHQNRWGYRSALKSIRVWREYITHAREFGKTLNSKQYLEVRYEELVQQPETSAKALFEYLEEPWEPEVLKFDESASYSKAVNYKNLVETRRQQDEKRSLIYRSRIGTGRSLDPLLKGLLYFHNRKLLEELGYL